MPKKYTFYLKIQKKYSLGTAQSPPKAQTPTSVGRGTPHPHILPPRRLRPPALFWSTHTLRLGGGGLTASSPRNWHPLSAFGLKFRPFESQECHPPKKRQIPGYTYVLSCLILSLEIFFKAHHEMKNRCFFNFQESIYGASFQHVCHRVKTLNTWHKNIDNKRLVIICNS